MSFTADQEELRRYARQWLDDKASLEAVRQTMETDAGFDAARWKEMGELGWLGMAVPEEHGGAGYGFGEVAVLGEEMGRGLFPSPFLSSVVMGTALVEALGTPEQVKDLLPAVVRGDKRLSVALVEKGGGWSAESFDTRATRSDEGWTLTGSKRFVVDGHTADTMLVAASTDTGVVVVIVDGDAVGLTRTRLDTMDLTRPLADVEFDAVQAEQLGDGGSDAAGALGAMLDRTVGYLAMEQVGAAQACLDMSVEYAKSRHQFGRAIGSFQAIKHMCADMLVAVESAKSAAYHLAAALDDDPAEVATAAALAKSYCSEAFYQCAADTIQIHGGIGFTWEHDAHLYFKRAKSSELIFGDPVEYRARLADILGI
jgi:alkylation response protein AidB-like acyl-CoA dehydrogenase